MEEKREKNIEDGNGIRISHKNILWIIYRLLAEEMNINILEMDKKK